MNHSFASLPSVKRRRSRFPDNFTHQTSMSVGRLYPICLEEVVAGDDFQEDLSFVSRLTSSYLKPVLDNLFMDLYAFYVPGRILYDGYEGVFGNPNPSAYVDNDLGVIPTLPSGTCSSKSVADYLGIPPGSVPSGLSVLPFRAFAMIWNEWFRNENTDNETYVQTGELAASERLNNNAWSASNYMGQLPYVGKIKDYFTSAVPEPQKGAPVSLPVSSFSDVPVTTGSTTFVGNTRIPMLFQSVDGSQFPGGSSRALLLYNGADIPAENSRLEYGSNLGSISPPFQDVLPVNLQAKTSSLTSSAVSVDELRLAMQKQLMLVADTMYGSRFREYLYGHFGVLNADGRMQVPEFLCGHRIPLSLNQVAQTSQGTEKQPLASLAGYSYTVGQDACKFFKGFTEPGYVIWVGCIRQKHKYQQGIRKLWGRSVRDDFYDPLYSHIGFQPIYTSELYSAVGDLKNTIFGWTEAWSEYKHTQSMVSGEVRSSADISFDIYNFADLYASSPVIGQQFNREIPDYVDRTLAIPSTSQDQFIVDFHWTTYKTRVMPVYCEPGYMDHWNR